MKILLGVTRTRIADNGSAYQMQRAADTWEIEIPGDGREYLSAIWMMADGREVLRLPLEMTRA